MKNPDGTPALAPTFVLATAARSAVERIAPEELAFLDDVLAAWERRDPTRRRRSAAGTVGLGIDVTLVAETVLAVLSGAAAEVLGAVATDAWQRRPRQWGGARTEAVPASRRNLPLTDDQADRLREACRRHGRTLGLSAEESDLLADAVHGSIAGPDHR